MLRSDFCLHKNQSHAPSFLLFRKRSRSVFLFVCKRTHLRKTIATNLFRFSDCGRCLNPIILPVPNKNTDIDHNPYVLLGCWILTHPLLYLHSCQLPKHKFCILTVLRQWYSQLPLLKYNNICFY